MKIRNRINAVFLSIFSAIFLFVGVFVYFYANRMIENSAKAYLFSSSKSRAENIRTYIDDQINISKIMAASSVYRDALKAPAASQDFLALKAKMEKRLQRSVGSVNDFDRLFVIGRDGKIAAASVKSMEGQDLSQENYFLKGQAGVYIQDVAYVDMAGKNVFIISAPINDDVSGELLGVSVAFFKTDKLNSLVSAENGLGSTEENFLINKDKYFLTPSRFLGESVILTRKVDTVNSRACFDAQEVGRVLKIGYPSSYSDPSRDLMVTAPDYRGINILGTHFYIPETGGCLITKVDVSEIFKSSQQLSLILAMIFGSSFLVIFILIFIVTGKITAPLNKLEDGVKNADSGNFDYNFSATGSEEVDSLARAFDSLAKSIKKARTDVNLKVQKQTKEISAKAAELAEQKLAILNILEDVNKERIIAELAAHDLEKFKLAVDNASDHIVIADAEGVVLYANRSVERITGFSNKEVFGHKAGNKDNWGGNMDKPFYENLWKTIKKDKKVFSGEIKNRRKNGEEYVALASISPVFDDDGSVIFFVGIERDITKEKEIDKVKTEFVSLASHQLRTPLSTINWYVEMLLEGDVGKLTKDQFEHLQQVYKSNKRMVELVNALLNVSRMELGTFTVEPKPDDIRRIADIAVEEISHKIKEKKIAFTKKYDSALKEMQLDEKITLIVFQNLLSNAVKYTPEGGKVKLEIKKKDKEAEIIVSDTGLGIPLSQQERIFTKLFRADNVRATDAEGTGLGLYLVKSIAEQTGGSIRFVSELNKGSTFYVTLPLSGMREKKGTRKLS